MTSPTPHTQPAPSPARGRSPLLWVLCGAAAVSVLTIVGLAAAQAGGVNNTTTPTAGAYVPYCPPGYCPGDAATTSVLPAPAVALSPSAVTMPPTAYDDVPSGPPPEDITLAEFTRIKTGMTHKQVTAIIGSPGVLSVESSLASYHDEIYEWRGEGYGNANVAFQNGKVTSKAQAGLS